MTLMKTLNGETHHVHELEKLNFMEKLIFPKLIYRFNRFHS